MRGFRAVSYAVWWRNAHTFFTNPAFIVPGLLFPMFFFTAFAGGLSRISSTPGFSFAPGYTAWVYAFVLMQASAFGGVFTGFSVARDYESGFSRRYMLEGVRSLLISGWDGKALALAFGLSGALAAITLTAASMALRTRMTRT